MTEVQESTREPEPHTCPHCNTVTWARAGQTSIRCRYCDRTYEVPKT